jgi:hypothetical protein
MMVHNPITEEIREIRHRLAAQFDNDIARIGEETRRRQALSGHRVVSLPSRTPVTFIPPNQPFHPSGEVIVSEIVSQASPPGER